MSNPAQYLAEFFERDGPKQHGESFFKLIHATVLLEEELNARERANVRVDHLRIAIPEARAAIRDKQSADLTIIETIKLGKKYRCLLDPRSISLLHVASDLIDIEDFADDATVESVRSLLQAVKQLVINDASIPPELRLFISKAVVSIENELDSFKVTGEFELREALLTLFGLMRAAESSSSDPTSWTNAWESWGKPIAQGLIVSIPQVALAAGAVFQQIQQ